MYRSQQSTHLQLLLASDIKSLQNLTPWLSAVENTVHHNTNQDAISFAAYHSKSDLKPLTLVCSNTMLPLLPDHIQSPATVRHLNIIIHITSVTNNGQPAVITADQPVYALAKHIQWKYPDLYGEDKLVFMMGGLHLEMAVQNLIGKWLAGSGWTDIFLKAGVATAGRCESLLRSSHVKRTRYAHEVSLASLSILRHDAYNADTENTSESLDTWVARRCKESVQFLYWQTTMELESLPLNFVRSIREANFSLFVQMLKEICPWFFALDLTHYSRWLPVFIRTLEELPVRHPQVYAAFESGHFTSRKTDAAFSAISDDHLHEQNNKVIKGDGGAVDILGNKTALLKWMIAGPEISRMVREFEMTSARRDNANATSHNQCHHEDTKSFQSRYIYHVSEVVKSIRDDGNPFAEQELQTADNQKILMTASAEKSVVEAEEKGQQQYQDFVENRLVYGRKSLREPLPKTKLELFHGPVMHSNKHKLKITDLRHDANTFCKMYVASQSCAGDVNEFFAHENNSCPPSISEFGKLRKARNKCDIVACLEDCIPTLQQTLPAESADSALIIDGAALVHMLSPGPSKTFHDYCSVILGPFVDRLLQTVQRLDIVFDQYLPNSLKSETRESRGSGQRINVKLNTLIPKNFNKFLAVSSNKQHLFSMISKFLVSRPTGHKLLICTAEQDACASHEGVDLSAISPCNAEEADGRMLLHAKHAVNTGLGNITIRTVDSDVVVIAIYACSHLTEMKTLWIDFGVGKSRRMIPVHELCRHLQHSVVSNLPFFHAFTGCDTVSTFCSIGKRTAWKAWMSFREVDKASYHVNIIGDG